MQETRGEDGCNDAVNQATPVPIATRVNIFRERLRNDIPARAKNGQPHHNTTGGGQKQLQPCVVLWRYCIPQLGKQMRSHFEYQNRKRQQQPQPEASCHVVKFITRPRGCRSYERLQCHSTDRTASGTTAAYLRVHRTCPHTFRILFSAWW